MIFNKKIKWEPNEHSLPMSREEKGSKVAGLFGFVFILGSSFLLYSLISNIEVIHITISNVIYLLFIALIAFFGVLMFNMFFYRKNTKISSKEVYCIEKSLFGKKNWTEPLSSYQGVLKEHNVFRGQNKRDHITWKINLKHKADSSRNIELYSLSDYTKRKPEDYDETWKHFAGLLKLPLLEKTSEGIKSIELQHKDMSLKNKVRNGLGKIDESEIQAKPGKSFKIQKKHEGYLVSVKTMKVKVQMFVFLLMLSSFTVFLFTEKHKSGNINILFYSFLAFTLLLALGFIWELISSEELFFSNSMIKHQRRYPWGVKEKQMLSSESVTSVDIKKPENNPRYHTQFPIVIEHSGKPVYFGKYMYKKDKTYIKNMLVKTISGN
ncbi:MAG: hypothetical protein ACQESB_06945 [Elusimicrobiota bacterium]